MARCGWYIFGSIYTIILGGFYCALMIWIIGSYDIPYKYLRSIMIGIFPWYFIFYNVHITTPLMIFLLIYYWTCTPLDYLGIITCFGAHTILSLPLGNAPYPHNNGSCGPILVYPNWNILDLPYLHFYLYDEVIWSASLSMFVCIWYSNTSLDPGLGCWCYSLLSHFTDLRH